MIKEDLNTSLAQTNNLKCLHTLDRLQSQTQISLEPQTQISLELG
jgi:hypothetical protein